MKSKPSHQGTQPGAATLGAQAPALPRAPPARLKMGRGSLWAGFWGRNGHFADFTAAWQSHPFSRRKDFVTRRALLIVFAVMFMAIAVNPVKNRNLISYGILLKLSYCGVVLFHWFTAGLPGMWKPFCVADLIFLLLFAWAWTVLGKETRQNG